MGPTSQSRGPSRLRLCTFPLHDSLVRLRTPSSSSAMQSSTPPRRLTNSSQAFLDTGDAIIAKSWVYGVGVAFRQRLAAVKNQLALLLWTAFFLWDLFLDTMSQQYVDLRPMRQKSTFHAMNQVFVSRAAIIRFCQHICMICC